MKFTLKFVYLWRVFLFSVAFASLMAAWAGYLQLTGNIYELDAGTVFRSGQLGEAQFRSFVDAHQIKTVINLRGENPNEEWYQNEIQYSLKNKIAYISLPFSANKEPSEQLLTQLITTLKTAERPLLIHCQGGADRTGLASALYQYLFKHLPPETAARQLSFRFGHFPWLWSETDAMDRTFWKVVNKFQPENSNRLAVLQTRNGSIQQASWQH